MDTENDESIRYLTINGGGHLVPERRHDRIDLAAGGDVILSLLTNNVDIDLQKVAQNIRPLHKSGNSSGEEQGSGVIPPEVYHWEHCHTLTRLPEQYEWRETHHKQSHFGITYRKENRYVAFLQYVPGASCDVRADIENETGTASF